MDGPDGLEFEVTIKRVLDLYGNDTAERVKEKICDICRRNNWNFCDIDARFFEISLEDGKNIDEAIIYWEIFGKVISEYELY